MALQHRARKKSYLGITFNLLESRSQIWNDSWAGWETRCRNELSRQTQMRSDFSSQPGVHISPVLYDLFCLYIKMQYLKLVYNTFHVTSSLLFTAVRGLLRKAELCGETERIMFFSIICPTESDLMRFPLLKSVYFRRCPTSTCMESAFCQTRGNFTAETCFPACEVDFHSKLF